jgi:hypothetical protein
MIPPKSGGQNDPQRSNLPAQYRQKSLRPEAEKWRLTKKNRQKLLKPEAENCQIIAKTRS